MMEFKVTDDYLLIRYELFSGYGAFKEMIIPKEIIIACYDKWIRGEENAKEKICENI